MNMSFTLNGRRYENFTAEEIDALDITDEEKKSAIAQGRKPKVSAECRRRIYATASPETQMNMATAGAFISSKTASARTDTEKTVLTGIEASLAWVSDMRANVAALVADSDLGIYDDANWPECPEAALAVVEMY